MTETQESIARPINRALEHVGLSAMPVENYNYYAGDGFDNAIRRALRDAGDEDLIHFEEIRKLARAWFAEDPLYHVHPYEGILQSLEVLRRKGILLTVFSNKPHGGAVDVVETIFGKGTFDHIQGQSDAVPIKPDPTGVFEILQKYGLRKEEVLYFGDTNTDMLTAHNAGVKAVGVTWGFRPRSELEAYHADRIIDSPSAIAELPELQE